MTTLSRFIISTTSLLGNPRFVARFAIAAFGLLVFVSCHNEIGEVGFKNPNRDFDVIAKEFIIPSRVYLTDSLSTSNGIIAVSPQGTKFYTATSRLLVGTSANANFGTSTATGYTVFAPSGWPYLGTEGYVEYEGAELTMIFDYYWSGSTTAANPTFEVYELNDSLITYLPYYNYSSTPYGKLLGQGTHNIDPTTFDQNWATNHDNDPSTVNILDSLNFPLDDDFGRSLYEAAVDTLDDNEYDFLNFRKFRRKFKGLAITSPNSDKIVGFDPENAKSRITIKYRIVKPDTVEHYKLSYSFVNPSQMRGTGEYMGYSNITTDRTGTPLAALPPKYQDFEPADGKRYVQAGTNLGVKLDFSEVYDYFKTIPNKALSVAELRFEGELQPEAPLSFRLRALKPNNREWKSTVTSSDIAGDPSEVTDADLYAKHLLVQSTFANPYWRMDAVGDTGLELSLIRGTSGGNSFYAGYLTNFLQQELSLTEADQLKYFAILPQSPDNSRSVNGFSFPAESLKLTIYYTVPKQQPAN